MSLNNKNSSSALMLNIMWSKIYVYIHLKYNYYFNN
jgi:hypothetical protein